MNPATTFTDTTGNIVSPSQTAYIHQATAGFDVLVIRLPDGCYADAMELWFCQRHRTAQRLVNALAGGVLTLTWEDCQGVVDVLGNTGYPLVRNEDEAVTLLTRLLEDSELRHSLRKLGLRIAEPFALENRSQSLLTLLSELSGQRISAGTETVRQIGGSSLASQGYKAPGQQSKLLLSLSFCRFTVFSPPQDKR
eukprot:2010858-Amphidinium_carterae.1